MQNCLTLESNFCPVRETAERAGVRVPWEVRGYREDAAQAEARGGFFDASHWGVVAITGPDARDYLNRMTTYNFNTFDGTQTAYGAFLTGRAGVVTLGMFLPDPGNEDFLYVVAPGQSTSVTEHIEKFHFQEDLKVTDVSAQWALFGFWNPPGDVAAAFGFNRDSPAMHVQSIRGAFGEARLWRDAARPSLFWVCLTRNFASPFLSSLRDHDVPLLGQHLFEYYRVKAGMPDIGVEVTDKDLILEANLQLAISRNKGCYPGQEVVERIFTYGQVNKKLLPISLEAEAEAGDFPSPPFTIHAGDKKAGTVMALLLEPSDRRRAIGLAYVQRQFWESPDRLASENGQARVRLQTAR